MTQSSEQTHVASIDPIGRPVTCAERCWRRYLMVFVTCAVALNALVGERGLLERWRAGRQMAAQASKLAELRDENARLRRVVELLKNDARTIEYIARDELGLVRPGEILVVVKDVDRR